MQSLSYRLVVLLWMLFILVVMGFIGSTRLLEADETLSFWVSHDGEAQHYLYDFHANRFVALENHPIDAILSSDSRRILEMQGHETGLEIQVRDAHTGRVQFRMSYPQLRADSAYVNWAADDDSVIAISYVGAFAKIHRIDLNTGTLRFIGEYYGNGSGIYFAPDKRHLVLRHLMFGNTNGTVVALETGELDDFGFSWDFAWSPDSRYNASIRVHRGNLREAVGINLYDTWTRQEIFLDAETLGGIPSPTAHLIWSQDSQTIYFALFHPVSKRGIGLYQYNLITETTEQLHSTSLFPQSVSPDGRYVLAHELILENRFTAYVLDTRTAVLSSLSLETELLSLAQSAWTDDSRYLALDYLPSGFTGDRLLQVYDARQGSIIDTTALSLLDFFPYLENLDSRRALAWWSSTKSN